MDETESTPNAPAAPADAPEEREREAAWRRGEARERARAAGEAPARGAYTGRARASVAARAFAALADNVRDYAIFLMNPDGVITFWGEGARLIKWWTKEQAEGAHLRLLYPPGGAEDGTAEGHLREAAERGESTGEGQRVRSDGSTFWAGITLTALWDEDGTLQGFAKVTRDLTARRAADALLQAAAVAAESARADAVAASTAKSGFLASMSHEIRTPVNAILGYHELLDLETDGPLTPGQRRHLARASASARHLLELITEVLDFSRIEADREVVRPAAFRVGDAVTAALHLVAPQARARGLELADAVSGYAGGLAAWGDERRVRQIVVNLLANAVKFTGGGDADPGRITVSVGTATGASPDARLSGPGPWVYVRVEDTGIGIPADRLQPIFDAFVQADMTLTRVHGGAGLGLAISRRLARLMGGDITVRSEVGLGSTFFLWLPAAPVESLRTGGLEGHGPGGEAPGPVGTLAGRDRPARAANPVRAARSRGTLRAVADAVLGELERVLHAYVARLRSDPATPSAHATSEAQVEDHLASFLADLAGALHQLDGAEGGAPGVPPGEPTAAAGDSAAIQHVVAERHGVQRARLGWTEQEVRREFTILREELAAAVRRRALDRVPGPTAGRPGEVERALELLDQFVAVAERLSLASFRRTASGATASDPGDPMTEEDARAG
jgi:PAS domain S-box-containing protein